MGDVLDKRDFGSEGGDRKDLPGLERDGRDLCPLLIGGRGRGRGGGCTKVRDGF